MNDYLKFGIAIIIYAAFFLIGYLISDKPKNEKYDTAWLSLGFSFYFTGFLIYGNRLIYHLSFFNLLFLLWFAFMSVKYAKKTLMDTGYL